MNDLLFDALSKFLDTLGDLGVQNKNKIYLGYNGSLKSGLINTSSTFLGEFTFLCDDGTWKKFYSSNVKEITFVGNSVNIVL